MGLQHIQCFFLLFACMQIPTSHKISYIVLCLKTSKSIGCIVSNIDIGGNGGMLFAWVIFFLTNLKLANIYTRHSSSPEQGKCLKGRVQCKIIFYTQIVQCYGTCYGTLKNYLGLLSERFGSEPWLPRYCCSGDFQVSSGLDILTLRLD